jgi:hypothetical protein
MAKKLGPAVTRPAGQISLFSAPQAPDAFRKAVQVVHSKPKSPLSLLQRKLGNAWLKNAIENDPDTDGWWQLGIKNLAQTIGFDSNNRQYLKDSAEALMRIIFEWDVIAPTSKRVPWKASVLFPEVEIGSDVLRYQISSQMRDRLTNPEIYALIDMNIVRKFRRASSLAIWEFCVRFEKVGRTTAVPWEKFRDMVLGESSENKTYREYKFFKSKVLNVAIAEINAESNHTITMYEVKVGRRIDSLQFGVSRKAGELSGPEDDRVVELLGEMSRFGVPQSEAKRIAKARSHDEIKGALDYTKRRMADKKLTKLENPPAYFRHALENRYAAAAPESAKGNTQRAEKAVDIKDAYSVHMGARAETYFKDLEPNEQQGIIDRYNRQQTHSILKLKINTSKVARTAFFNWLASETWGAPSSDTLLVFAQQMLSAKTPGAG